MEYITHLAEQMDEELDGAEEYAREACKHKSDHPAYAKHLHDMSMDELRHAQYINDEAQRYIKESTDSPEFRHVWDFIKNHADKRISRINDMLVQFRDG